MRRPRRRRRRRRRRREGLCRRARIRGVYTLGFRGRRGQRESPSPCDCIYQNQCSVRRSPVLELVVVDHSCVARVARVVCRDVARRGRDRARRVLREGDGSALGRRHGALGEARRRRRGVSRYRGGHHRRGCVVVPRARVVSRAPGRVSGARRGDDARRPPRDVPTLRSAQIARVRRRAPRRRHRRRAHRLVRDAHRRVLRVPVRRPRVRPRGDRPTPRGARGRSPNPHRRCWTHPRPRALRRGRARRRPRSRDGTPRGIAAVVVVIIRRRARGSRVPDPRRRARRPRHLPRRRASPHTSSPPPGRPRVVLRLRRRRVVRRGARDSHGRDNRRAQSRALRPSRLHPLPRRARRRDALHARRHHGCTRVRGVGRCLRVTRGVVGRDAPGRRPSPRRRGDGEGDGGRGRHPRHAHAVPRGAPRRPGGRRTDHHRT